MKSLRLIVMLLATAGTEAALAHTELTATVPADRAVIETAPEALELEFSEPVRLTALTLQKDSEAKRSLGPLPSQATEAFAVALPALDDGHYVVSWRALSEDTHVMTGEFMFVVGADGRHDEHMDHAAMPAAGQADGTHHDDHSASH